MRALLEWGEENKQAIETTNELDALLDDLVATARENPFLVELVCGDAGSLSLGLGHDATVLDYVPADLNPPYLQSVGGDASQKSLWFRFRGDMSEFPPQAAIPNEVGRDALRYFLETGELTPRVSWRET